LQNVLSNSTELNWPGTCATWNNSNLCQIWCQSDEYF